jgi:predicted ATP-grasp superfamily ATP-dependent carboligase
MKTESRRILVLDAETRSALAVTRSLGRAGAFCITASSHQNPLAGSSRFSSLSLHCPDIRENPEIFHGWLLKTIKTHDVNVVLPVTDATIEGLSSYSENLKKTVFYPVVSPKTLAATQNKSLLLGTAREIGIRTPYSVSITINSPDHREVFEKLKERPGFPCIMKPEKSVQRKQDGTIFSPPCSRITSESDIKKFVSSLDTFPLSYMAQELIEGSGAGVFCLYHNNKSILDFAHRRILEKPPEGGVSVLSESFPAYNYLLGKTHTLLQKYSWEGVAMVEYRIDHNGSPFLMEINPRFWGSLQLAIDAGYDFPRALIYPEQVSGFELNLSPQRLRWELGTLDHLLIRYKRKGIMSLLQGLASNEFQFFKPDTRGEILRLSDPLPFLAELRNYAGV